MGQARGEGGSIVEGELGIATVLRQGVLSLEGILGGPLGAGLLLLLGEVHGRGEGGHGGGWWLSGLGGVGGGQSRETARNCGNRLHAQGLPSFKYLMYLLHMHVSQSRAYRHQRRQRSSSNALTVLSTYFPRGIYVGSEYYGEDFRIRTKYRRERFNATLIPNSVIVSSHLIRTSKT